MENRDQDKLNRNKTTTPADDLNRKPLSDIGKNQSGTSAEFGKNIGRSEKSEVEPSRKNDTVGSSGLDSSKGRSGSSGSLDEDVSHSSDSSDMPSSSGRKPGSMGGNSDSRH